MKYLKIVLGILLVLLITGCATSMKPGLDKKTAQIDLGEDSLFLLTIELSNKYKPAYQPNALILNVEAPKVSSNKDRFNFPVDNDGSILQRDGNKYIFRGRIKPGKYVIQGIEGNKSLFPINGIFYMPLHCEFEAKKGQILDLGKVIAQIRERKGNEFRAGPLLPLLDQSIPGFSGGTFDIQIVENSNADTKWMKSLFPALNGVQIITATLPPFDREKAQKWWETH
jgi:hypothetical protein